jgi:hypothetical protein
MEIDALLSPQDLARVGETLSLYAQATTKDLPDISNRAARQAAIFASSKTPKADPNRIQEELRRTVAYQVFAKKTGKRLKKARAITKRTRLANAIVWARAVANGEKITSAIAEKRGAKMTAGRKSAVGFLKSGYIPALEKFGARRLKDGRQRGKPKGAAKKATDENPEAMVSNQVQGRQGGVIVKMGSAAMREALRDVDRDMRAYAEKKLAKRTAEANGR